MIDPEKDLYVALMALNAVDYLGEKARPLAAKVNAVQAPKRGHRANDGINKLVRHIQANLGEKPPADSPPAGRGGKKKNR